MYARSRVKRKSFYEKSELQMFLLISGGHIGGQFLSTNIGVDKTWIGSPIRSDDPIRDPIQILSTPHQYGVSIQSSTRVREMSRPIT